jgi:hypothetical protein
MQLSSNTDVTQGKSGVPKVSQGVGHVTHIVGVTQRGPVGIATMVRSWTEFEQIFGWHGLSYDGTMAVWNFYKESGGVGEVWVTRVVHYNPSTHLKTSVAATLNLNSGGTGTLLAATLECLAYSDGTYGNALAPTIGNATNGRSDYFDLGIQQSGVVVATIPNCTMDSTSNDYVVTKVALWNGANDQLMTVVDLAMVGTPAQRRPANTSASPTKLSSGDDGLVGLTDTDWSGDATAGNGILAGNAIGQPTLLLCPNRATAQVANAEITYDEQTRGKRLFSILDTPANLLHVAAVQYLATTAAIQNLTQCAAAFWPWPRIDNPDPAIFGSAKTIAVPPSGLVAGVFQRAATATRRGYAENPAGLDYPFFSVRGFENEDDARRQPHEVCAGLTGKNTRDYVFPNRLNPLRVDPGTPFYIDGEYTLSAGAAGSWDTTGKQIAGQAVMRAFAVGLDPVRHRNHTQQLEDEANDATNAYLRSLCRDGYFASMVPKEAYSTDFGPGQNTADTKAAKQLNGQVGIALSDPAIFVNIVIASQSPAFVTVA